MCVEDNEMLVIVWGGSSSSRAHSALQTPKNNGIGRNPSDPATVASLHRFEGDCQGQTTLGSRCCKERAQFSNLNPLTPALAARGNTANVADQDPGDVVGAHLGLGWSRFTRNRAGWSASLKPSENLPRSWNLPERGILRRLHGVVGYICSFK